MGASGPHDHLSTMGACEAEMGGDRGGLDPRRQGRRSAFLVRLERTRNLRGGLAGGSADEPHGRSDGEGLGCVLEGDATMIYDDVGARLHDVVDDVGGKRHGPVPGRVASVLPEAEPFLGVESGGSARRREAGEGR